MSYQFVEDHREYIRREFKFRLNRRPLYSQRAYARDLGLSPSTLTDYLKDRLALSSGRILQLSKQLGLNKEQAQHWVDLITNRFSRNQAKKKESLISINARLRTEKNAVSLDEFRVISEWQHLAFLEMIQMNSLKYSDIKTSCKSLGLTQKSLKQMIQRLLDLKLLKKNVDNIFSVDYETYVGNEAPSEAIRSFHSQILKKAQKSLETDSSDKRYNSSTFIAINNSQIPSMIEHLKKSPTVLLDPVIKENTNQTTDTLYCLSIQFFNPLQAVDKATQ